MSESIIHIASDGSYMLDFTCEAARAVKRGILGYPKRRRRDRVLFFTKVLRKKEKKITFFNLTITAFNPLQGRFTF
jgi:hypothetical protein